MLISELICGAKFSFAHGGKDGFPYPVDRKIYDSSILTLKEAVEQSKIGNKEKSQALKRLNSIVSAE